MSYPQRALRDVVEQWRRRNSEVPTASAAEVAARKREDVFVVIPAHNEEATIGQTVATINPLVGSVVNAIIVLDDCSEDATAQRAWDAGAQIFSAKWLHPGQPIGGKGAAMWRAVDVVNTMPREQAGDPIVVFVDADVSTLTANWVTALADELIRRPEVRLVKAAYPRLGADGNEGTGGRVTQLMALPALGLWFPELGAVEQPLAGEQAARLSFLEQVDHFPVGYAVEVALLIAALEEGGLDAIAQVTLGARQHRHQALGPLARQAAEILHAILRRAQRHDGMVTLPPGAYELLLQGKDVGEVETRELPSIASLRSRGDAS